MSDAPRVLDVELTGPVAEFYREVEARLAAEGITLSAVRNNGPEFGGFYTGEGTATVTVRFDIPAEAVPHTIAHELVHGLQRREGWPRASANPDLGDDSPAEEVAAVLQALAQCSAAELRIAPLGLDPSWQQHERQRNIRAMLRAPHEGANVRDQPAWAYWSLLYAYLDLIHDPERSRTLLRNIGKLLPEAAAAGKEAARLVREHGYATREQALAALRAVQEALELAPHIVVEDPREGAVYG